MPHRKTGDLEGIHVDNDDLVALVSCDLTDHTPGNQDDENVDRMVVVVADAYHTQHVAVVATSYCEHTDRMVVVAAVAYHTTAIDLARVLCVQFPTGAISGFHHS